PNPARNYTEIQIASDVKGKYNLMMYNINGQLVYNNNITVNSGLNTQRINTSTFAKGIYRIVLVSDQNTNVYSNTLIVQ
ncbi:MAG: T9SS type A sorting domain-containing protein, partial [Chitinophagales bacterium]|nr:T9SS type A sorting domain-containing protein [Chitinophagales bacterium]